ncbi:sulfite exporter TauE/SafE family protein [Alteromonas sp. CYL-A6]|uniref:sulfite exporter TauE/SafE family protein n=1 Tax=Alteromonas nitratireducens TaxID=3390813 RepID=UPI003983653F
MLISMSALTSLITATLGIGGGMLLLAVMAGSMPLSALIPVHGLVQLGSNANRALMTWRHIDWTLLRFFSVGAVVGAVMASFIVVQLPLVLIQVAVALFILFLVWGAKPKAQEMRPAGRILAGMITTVISMFVGATGPLVAAFVHRNRFDKMQLTAAFSSCMTVQHGLKAFVFSAIGFSFWQWAGLTLAMIASGAVGTWVGLHVLRRIPSARFAMLFKVVVTILALRLLYQAAISFYG